jgi:hypothetical protein
MSIVYSPAMITRKHELSGLSLREIERRSKKVTAARLCLYESGKTMLRQEQLDAVNCVLEAEIRDRRDEIAQVLDDSEAVAV